MSAIATSCDQVLDEICRHVVADVDAVNVVMLDDYDDEVAAVVEEHRKKIKYSCAPCKPDRDRPPLPCITACAPAAITHSW